jgi:hypothetical protein
VDIRGHLILEFVDNTLLDGPGNDLFVYITNDKPCRVEISADGSQYISVGVTVGYPGAIDIGPFVTAGTQFRFVRLSDVPSDEDHSSCPGSSIDAVGAMGPEEAIAVAVGKASGSLEVQPVGGLALAGVGGANELLIILDHSSSMAEMVEGEVKITVAKEVILDLLSNLGTGAKVGFREFASCESSELLVPVQPLDAAAFGSQVNALTPAGATPIAYTLEQVKGDFPSTAGTKLILLITDGMETCGGDPLKAAESLLAAGYDLRINVVGFDIGQDSRARDQLMQIAEATGGVFLAASNREELRRALSLSAPFSYSVFDSSGALVYSGRLGEATGPELPAGVYRVVVDTQPVTVVENVVVLGGKTTIVPIGG